jgi:hypothetical protein
MSHLIWLAADYHFPTLYSIRAPLSSMSSARTLPAPGPSTVRLALVRVGIELFGEDVTRNMLFPILRAMPIAIRPPERVAISTQLLRVYKATENKKRGEYQYGESIGYREYAHAQGTMTVYIEVPENQGHTLVELLQAVGYWGQAHSFTHCVSISTAAPLATECLRPLRTLSSVCRVQHLTVSLVSEFRSPDLKWDEIAPNVSVQPPDPLTIELHVWPLTVIEQHQGDRLLLRCSI